MKLPKIVAFQGPLLPVACDTNSELKLMGTTMLKKRILFPFAPLFV